MVLACIIYMVGCFAEAKAQNAYDTGTLAEGKFLTTRVNGKKSGWEIKDSSQKICQRIAYI